MIFHINQSIWTNCYEKMLEKLKKIWSVFLTPFKLYGSGNSKEISPRYYDKILLFPNALDFGKLYALSYKQQAYSSIEVQKWVDGYLAA